MPEGIEVEYYRRQAEAVVGRSVERAVTPDAWYLKGGIEGSELGAALVGSSVVKADRIGKLLLIEFDSGHRLGLRFGMTGRLVVDGAASIEYLEYTTRRDDPAWDRFRLDFDDGGFLAMRDPRRLGGVELDPSVSRLGPDLFSVSLEQMAERVLVGAVAVKTRMLDQSRMAGVGNLIADETLWQAGIDPARKAASLTADERRRIHQNLCSVVERLCADGGSHRGRLQDQRHDDGRCPLDGAVLWRRTIGGRATYSCPVHQV